MNIVAVDFQTREVEKPRRRYTRLTSEQVARLRADIEALQEPGKADYVVLADKYQVSLRKVQMLVSEVRAGGYVRNDDTGAVVQHALPDNALAEISACRTSKGAWRKLHASGVYRGTYSSWTRATNRAYGKNVILGACRGTAAMSGDVFETRARRPFMHTYSVDLFAVRAPLLHRGQVIRPYALVVREDHTGVLVNSWIFDTDAVDAAMVACALGQAINGTTFALEDREQFLGGIPDLVLCDNGSNFTAAELNELLAGTGIRVQTINSYSSHENGAHERVHETLRDRLLRAFPGSSDGPIDHRGRLMDEREPLTLDQAREMLANTVWELNKTTDHRGSTPVERWQQLEADGGIVRRAGVAEMARFAYPHPESCKKYKLGVRLNNAHFFTPRLSRYTQKRFFVHTWFGDPDHVELFTTDGQHVGRAVRNGAQSAAESQANQAHRHEERDVVRAAIQDGTRIADQNQEELQRRTRPVVSPGGPAALIPDAGDPATSATDRQTIVADVDESPAEVTTWRDDLAELTLPGGEDE